MTAVSPPVPSRHRATPVPASGPSQTQLLLRRLKPWFYHRWLQLPLVLSIAWLLLYDRYVLCKQYLFRYTDEDQTIMWYAAHELLHGRLHEPCFFGQDYN